MMSTQSSTRHQLFLAGLAFSVVILVGYGSDLILMSHPRWMIADDLILGVAAALIVFHYEIERGRILSEKLRVIRDMNAFVRNELQLLYAYIEHPDKGRIAVIERSVEHIDWALRELLPGRHHLSDAPVQPIRESGDSINRTA